MRDRMAKRSQRVPDSGPAPRAAGNTTSSTSAASGTNAADAVAARVAAFAELLGRVAGTVQAKAQVWADRDTLHKQITMVRDGAAELLEHLAGGAPRASSAKNPSQASAGKPHGGRSGGVVDAPGKKRRKPPASDPDAILAESQAAKMRTAGSMAKTSRLRGRG